MSLLGLFLIFLLMSHWLRFKPWRRGGKLTLSGGLGFFLGSSQSIDCGSLDGYFGILPLSQSQSLSNRGREACGDDKGRLLLKGEGELGYIVSDVVVENLIEDLVPSY